MNCDTLGPKSSLFYKKMNPPSFQFVGERSPVDRRHWAFDRGDLSVRGLFLALAHGNEYRTLRQASTDTSSVNIYPQLSALRLKRFFCI